MLSERRQVVDLDSMGKILQGFLSQIDAGGQSAGAQPLDEIRARAEADFQHLLAAITCKLGKRVDERLMGVAPPFDLLKVFPRELRGLRLIGVATLALPEFLDLLQHSFLALEFIANEFIASNLTLLKRATFQKEAKFHARRKVRSTR